MATDSISGAIVERFRSIPSLVSLCPQMYAEEIPETDAAGNALLPPFALVEVPEETTNWNFESTAAGGYEVFAQVVITVFATTVALRDQIAAAFAANYDWQGLDFESADVKSLAMDRERTSRGREEYQDANGNRVFHASLHYQAIVSK